MATRKTYPKAQSVQFGAADTLPPLKRRHLEDDPYVVHFRDTGVGHVTTVARGDEDSDKATIMQAKRAANYLGKTVKVRLGDDAIYLQLAEIRRRSK